MYAHLLVSTFKFKIYNQMSTEPYNPFIISHRGYSSILPENTLESIEAALYKSHLVEFDILLTKDDQIVVFHDRNLSELTNVTSFKEFQSKKTEFVNDFKKGEKTNDWWVKDFTLDELRKLKIMPKSSKRPHFRHQSFKISTFGQVIEEILYIKSNYLKANTCGLLVQIKCQQESTSNVRDKLYADKIIQSLKYYGLTSQQKCKEKNLPILIQSFNHQIIQQIAKSDLDLPLYYLLDKDVTVDRKYLQELGPKVKGISVSVEHLKPAIKQLCVQEGKKIFFWTLIDDQPQHLQNAKIPTFKDAYFHLFKLQFDGIITDFPQKCQEYLNLFKIIQK